MKIEQRMLNMYPVGQNFRRNSSISHGLGEKEILSFTIFVKNYKIQNGRHFWREEIFWELSRVLSRDTLWVKNFVEVILSRTV